MRLTQRNWGTLRLKRSRAAALESEELRQFWRQRNKRRGRAARLRPFFRDDKNVGYITYKYYDGEKIVWIYFERNCSSFGETRENGKNQSR